jgi:hypothetical protein
VTGLKWQPWEGSPGGPSPIPAATGIIAEQVAFAADIPLESIIGRGGAAAMRGAVLATLGVVDAAGDVRVTVKAIVAFTAALVSRPSIARAVKVAWASGMHAVETSTAFLPGSAIARAVEAMQEASAALTAVIDTLTTEEVQKVTTAMDDLSQSGINASGAHAGAYVAMEVAKRLTSAAGGATAPGAPPFAAVALPAAAGTGRAQATGAATGLATFMAGLGVTLTAEEAAAEAAAGRQVDAMWQQFMGPSAEPLVGQQRRDAIAALGTRTGGAPAPAAGPGLSGARAAPPTTTAATQAARTPAFSALQLPTGHGPADADIFTELANGAGVSVIDVAGMLAGVRGRSAALNMGNTATTLVGMARYDFEAIVAKMGAKWHTTAPSWREAAHRLQVLCADFETSAAEGGQAGTAKPEAARAGWAGEDERSAIPVSASSVRSTSANVIRTLGNISTITAETSAIKETDALKEAARLSSNTEYGPAAAAYLMSDGSSTAKVGPKGKPTPRHSANG